MLFVVAGGAIAFSGVRLAHDADRLADRLGWGEALTGTLVLGGLTALPGLAASVAAALDGRAALAIANAIGGIAVQTVILPLADLTLPRANLEHAAASYVNLIQALLLIVLLTIVLLGLVGPDTPVGPVHPATGLMIVAAGFSWFLLGNARREPMWRPQETEETIPDVPEPEHEAARLGPLVASLAGSGTVTLLSGVVIASTAREIVIGTAIPEVVVGGILMAFATSSPELVTCIAAVRRGAPTLAVSDIVGGNLFDVFFVAAADIAYLRGSLFHAPGVGAREAFLTAVTILLNLVLLTGLVLRQKHGPANIGFEGVLMIAIYAAGFAVLAWGM